MRHDPRPTRPVFDPRSALVLLRMSAFALGMHVLNVAHAEQLETATARERIVVLTSDADPAFFRGEALTASRTALLEVGVELGLAPRPPGATLEATLPVARGAAAAGQALAVVWLDVEQRGVTLYFFASRRGRLLSRRVAVSASAAAAAEEIAIVLRSAASALLEGAAPEMTEVRVAEPPPPPPAPEPVQAEAPPVAAASESRLALQAAYFGTWFAEQQGLASGARIAAVTRPFVAELRLGLAYTWFPKLSVETESIEVSMTRHPGELWVAYELGNSRLRFAPELALMLDALTRRTESVESPWVASPPSTRWVFATSLRARVLLNVAARFWLTGSAGACLVTNPFSQVATAPALETELLSLRSFRPELELGLRIDVF